jgi:hypothetical protein
MNMQFLSKMKGNPTNARNVLDLTNYNFLTTVSTLRYLEMKNDIHSIIRFRPRCGKMYAYGVIPLVEAPPHLHQSNQCLFRDSDLVDTYQSIVKLHLVTYGAESIRPPVSTLKILPLQSQYILSLLLFVVDNKNKL